MELDRQLEDVQTRCGVVCKEEKAFRAYNGRGTSRKVTETFKEIGREPISRLKDPLRFRLPASRFIEMPFNQA